MTIDQLAELTGLHRASIAYLDQRLRRACGLGSVDLRLGHRSQLEDIRLALTRSHCVLAHCPTPTPAIAERWRVKESGTHRRWVTAYIGLDVDDGFWWNPGEVDCHRLSAEDARDLLRASGHEVPPLYGPPEEWQST